MGVSWLPLATCCCSAPMYHQLQHLKLCDFMMMMMMMIIIISIALISYSSLVLYNKITLKIQS